MNRRSPGGGYTVQPARYSDRTYSAGTLVFATSPVCESISSTWAVRSARLPSSTISVSGPAWSGKFEPAGVPPLHAAIHSAYTLSSRGYFCAGGGAGVSACRASSSRRAGEVRPRGVPPLPRRAPFGVPAPQPRILLRRGVSGDLPLPGLVEQARV